MTSPGATDTPTPLRIWISALRLRTLPAAVSPVVVGSAIAAHDHHFDSAAAGLCLVFALLVQVGTNFANDYYDFVHGADNASRVGPRRAVASGLVTPEAMRRATAAVFAAAFIAGLGLIHWGGPWMLAVGLASIACGIAYTGGPWPLAYHGMGDLFVFVFFGLVAVCVTYFVQAARVSAHSLLAGASMGLLCSNILLVNNYRDLESDSDANKRTLVVRFGRRFARGQFLASLAVSFGVPILFLITGYRAWCLLPLLLLPMAVNHMRRLSAGATPPDLVSLLGDTAKLMAAYAALFALGILL